MTEKTAAERLHYEKVLVNTPGFWIGTLREDVVETDVYPIYDFRRGSYVATCDSCQDSVSADFLQNFRIVRYCNKYDVSFHEALIIKRLKPSLTK